MSEVIYYLAMALFVIGAVSYGVYFNFMVKNKLRLQGNILITKCLVYLGICFFGILIGLVLFTVAFYLDPATISLVENNNLTVDAGHQFLSYFFIILFSVFCFTFLTSFLYYFYLPELDSSLRKVFKIIMYSSIPLMVVTFILFSEGNAPYLSYPLCNSIYIGKHGIKFINSYVHPEPYYTYSGGRYSLDGGISIAFYAIFILSGAFLVLAICDHFIYKIYGKHDIVTTCFFVAFPSGLVGARLWYVVLDISKEGASSQYVRDWTKIFSVWDGGLGIMGGAILGIIAGVSVMLIIKYWKKDPVYQKISYLRLADIIIPTILVAQAIGRIGNFFNCEVHGNQIPLDSIAWLPTFIKTNYQYNYATQISNTTMAYLPLATIETITNLIGYFFIYFGICRGLGKYHAEGSGAGWYLVWYGATRALLEPLRSGTFQYDLSISSSYFMIGAGLFIVLVFAILKYLREKKLWLFKNYNFVDEVLVQDTRDEKTLRRDIIIVASIALLIVLAIIILFNIW